MTTSARVFLSRAAPRSSTAAPVTRGAAPAVVRATTTSTAAPEQVSTRSSSFQPTGGSKRGMAFFGSLFGVGAASKHKEDGMAYLEKNKANPGVTSLPSGLQYKVLKSGGGKAHPRASTPCDCHYEGKLLDGQVFDSSYARGEPTTFAPNQVIPGWTEAMQLMVEGDEWELYIPSDMAYGDRGTPGGPIPGGATLVFKMQICRIKGPSVPKQ